MKDWWGLGLFWWGFLAGAFFQATLGTLIALNLEKAFPKSATLLIRWIDRIKRR